VSAYLKPGLAGPVASPDGLDAPFWQGTREDKLLLQRCGSANAGSGDRVDLPSLLEFRSALRTDRTARRDYSYERIWHPVHRR
jgi:hypothetical protein